MLTHDAHQFDPDLLSSLYVDTCDAEAANGQVLLQASPGKQTAQSAPRVLEC